jgi:hypothetical protein
VKKILLLNNAKLAKDNTNTQIDKFLTGEQFDGDKLALDAYENGLMQALRNNGYVVETLLPRNISNADGSVNWSVLDSIFTVNNTQTVITINFFDSDAHIGGVILADALGQTQNYLYGKSTISIYCDNHLVIQDVIVDAQFSLPTSGSLNPIALINDIVNKRKFYNNLGSNVGFKAGTFFGANWYWVNRDFYNKGSKGLRQAKKMIYFGNWDIAQKKLMYILQTSKKNKVLARASYNLALVYEGQGDIDMAISTAEKSSIEYNCKKAPAYLQILLQRKKQVQIIEWQKSQ